VTAGELRATLVRLRLRQGTLAEALGIHRVTVARWMSGKADVPRYAIAYLDLLQEHEQLKTASYGNLPGFFANPHRLTH
jgi:DNA-binding transcriptional regulator YiaG